MSSHAVKRDRGIIVDAVGSWRTDRVLLTEQDALRLRVTLASALVESMRSGEGPAEEALELLATALRSAAVVPPERMPADVVTMRSRLVLKDAESGRRREVVLVYPEEERPHDQGRVGDAARELARVLHPHFVREEEIALPPLGLLDSLSKAPPTPEMREVLRMTDALRAELPKMLQEHVAIGASARHLEAVARAERNADVEKLAQNLQLHAKSEEELFYPAALSSATSSGGASDPATGRSPALRRPRVAGWAIRDRHGSRGRILFTYGRSRPA
jgi:transcription elongation GreA/GreB family factor